MWKHNYAGPFVGFFAAGIVFVYLGLLLYIGFASQGLLSLFCFAMIAFYARLFLKDVEKDKSDAGNKAKT
jgi:membrane protein implicated in regulation of membrane protease activity